MSAFEVRLYRTADGDVPMTEWLNGLRDDRARVWIVARLDRLRAGLRGDWKGVGGPVWELRIDYGPGYRVYCASVAEKLFMVLCGGDKRSQVKHIERAHDYWEDYKSRVG